MNINHANNHLLFWSSYINVNDKAFKDAVDSYLKDATDELTLHYQDFYKNYQPLPGIIVDLDSGFKITRLEKKISQQSN